MKIVNQSANVLVPESPMKHIEKIGRICYKSEDKIADGTDKRFVKMLYDNNHHAMLEHYRFIMNVNPMIYELLSSVDHTHIGMTHCEYEGKDRFLISFNARALIDLVKNSRAEHHGVLPMAVESVKNELMGHIIRKYDCHELFGLDRAEYMPLLSSGIDFIENDELAMNPREFEVHGWMSVHMITDRGISHEIVRHREETSFAQESTRYCNYNNNKFGGEITVIDQGFMYDERAKWECAMKYCEEMYNGLVNHYDIKPEMARSVLPTCLKTEIVMTAPWYEWEHFFDLRLFGMTGKPHPLIKRLSKMAYNSILKTFFKSEPQEELL